MVGTVDLVGTMEMVDGTVVLMVGTVDQMVDGIVDQMEVKEV